MSADPYARNVVAEWIERLAGRAFSGGVANATLLAGGEINETYLVTSTSGDRVVCRLAPEVVADWHPDVEGQVAAMRLAREAGVPVPEVVFHSGRVLAYQYVVGAPPTPPEVTPMLAREVGRLHGLLHRHGGDGVGPVQADGTSARWPIDVAFRDVPGWVEQLLAQPALSDRAASLEAAANLVAGYHPHSQSRLLHGDVSPANTIVNGGAIAAIIDFDDAWFGDPAGDMAWWWWNHPPTGEDFVAGCSEVNEPPDPRTVWMYRLRLLLGLADTFATTNPTRATKDLLASRYCRDGDQGGLPLTCPLCPGQSVGALRRKCRTLRL